MVGGVLVWNEKMKRAISPLIAGVMAILISAVATAQITPSATVLLNSDGTTDERTDERPQIETDGAGNWVAVWDVFDDPGSPTGTDLDIFTARSTDAGQTWSAPVPLNSNATTDAGDDLRPALTTDGDGVWIAIWYSNENLGGVTGGDYDIFFSRSTNAGQTWSAPALLNINGTTDSGTDEIPRIASDGAGNWVAVWDSNESLDGVTGFDYEVFVSTSSDGGQTWSAPEVLNSDAVADEAHDIRTEIVTDRLGNWVVAWGSNANVGGPIADDYDIFVSRSTDNGGTWSVMTRLDPNDLTDVGEDERPALATDGLGNWVAAWHADDNLGGLSGTDSDIFVSRSTDGGATWTAEALLNTNGNSDTGNDEFVRLTTDSTGNWIAIWDSNENLGGLTGTDFDIFYARSTNLGLTWTAPALFNASGTTDTGLDLVAQIATDRAGNWVATWESNDTLGGTTGTDWDILTSRFTLNPGLAAIAITPETTGPTNAETVSFDVTFSHDTQNFNNAADVVVTHSGTSNTGVTISGGPRIYTVQVNGLLGEGSFRLAISTASDVQNLSGDPLLYSVTSALVTIERVPPTIGLSTASQDPTNIPVLINAVLSEASTNFVAGDVTPTNATVSGFSGSGTSYSFSITPITDGAFGAIVNAGAFTDAIGNGNIASNSISRIADLTGPVVTLSSAASAFVNGSIGVSVSLNEASTNFTAGDVTVSNATVSNFAGSGTSYSFTLTPDAEGAFGAVVEAGDLTDALGNLNSESNTLVRTADFTAPDATLSSGAGDPVNGAISVSVSLTESSANFAAGDVTVTNATVSGFTGSGASYSFTLTPDADGAFDATINAGAFTDAAGNGNNVSNTLARTADLTDPTIVLSSVAANPTNGAIVVSADLSEASVNFASGDLVPTNAAVSGFSGSGDSYSFTLTPTTDGSFSVAVDADSFTDEAANGNTASNVYSNTADLTSPTASLTSAAADPVNGAITVEIDLSEASTDFDDGDLSLTNATLSDFTGSGDSYSFTLTPDAEGAFTASVPAGTFTDPVGNANTVSNTFTRTADLTAPTVLMSSTAPNPTNEAPISVTVTFSEPVTGFAEADISAGNATISDFAGSGDSYTFDLTPSGEGAVTADIAATVAIDAAGNANTTAPQFSRTYDSVLPGVSMSSVASDPTNTSPISVTVTFDEPVTGFVVGDILAANANVSNFAGSGASYSFDLAPIADGAVTADIEPAVAVDAAGNANTAATQFSRTYDSTAPTAVLSSSSGDPVNGAISVDVALSESSVNFGSDDITVTNGTLSDFAGSGQSYSFTLTPDAEGAFSASVDAGAFTDAAGNTNSASNTLTRTADFTSPTATLSSAAGSSVNAAIAVSVALSDPSTDFESADITLVNATLSDFAGAGASYTFTLTPDAEGSFSASIDAGEFTDSAGNANSASNTLTRTADFTAPTVGMSSSASDPTNGNPIPISVTFSEPVTGFIATDVVPGNATVENFAGSGADYTFNLVPSGEGAVSADIAADVATDAAGNLNSAATQFSRVYDSVAPTVTLSSAAGNPVNGAFSVSVVLSSITTEFTSGDLVLTNATASAFTGSGTSYSFTLTPSADGTTSVSVADGAFTDAAGNANTASNTLSRTADLTRPTVSMSSTAANPTNVSPIPVTVAFSESVIGFTAGDVVAGNASVTNFTGSGDSYSFSLVPTAGGSVTANIAADVSTDAAGNTNTAATQFSRVYNQPPVIAPINDVTVSDAASYSVTPALQQGSGTITWSLTAPASPPTNMSINSSTGQLTWTANFAFGPVDVIITATGPGGSDTESWRITVLPPPIWVDFAYTGVETGTVTQPFNTLSEAVNAAVAGDEIRIKGNTATKFSLETGTISKPLYINATGGTIRVGGNFSGGGGISGGVTPVQGNTGFISRNRNR